MNLLIIRSDNEIDFVEKVNAQISWPPSVFDIHCQRNLFYVAKEGVGPFTEKTVKEEFIAFIVKQ